MSSRPGIPLLMPSTITRSRLVDESGILTPEAKRWLTELPKNHAFKVRSRLRDSHKERLKHKASEFAEGVLWKETDTGLTYISDGENWEFQSGTLTAEQNNLPVLTANDAGALVFVSDYAHTLLWNGAGWQFAPGDTGSGFTQTFLIDPGVGWQACDGTVGVLTLLSDGSLDASVTVPNTANLWYRQ